MQPQINRGEYEMKMDLITRKHDEYYTPEYAIYPIMKYIPNGSSIWCPFDTSKSNYVKLFSENNHVDYSHINYKQDFFSIDYNKEAIIISNPPYSRKAEVFERLFQLENRFAMLVGVVGLFESKKRFNLFKNNDFEIMYFDKRISYFEDYNDQKPKINPPFSSVYITRGILPQKIIFEDVLKS